MTKPIIKKVSVFVLFTFLLNQLSANTSVYAAASMPSRPEVQLGQAFSLNLPAELGTIEAIHSGNKASIIHIQEPHGNYEAQKKIEAILGHLKSQYGYDLLLLEGAASRLQPELAEFEPGKPEVNLQILEELAKQSYVTGSELFLYKERQAQAYGIEEAETYKANRKAFVEVIRARETAEKFLQDFNQQITRLTSPYLNEELKEYLKRLDAFETKIIPMTDWLNYLKADAEKVLGVNLEDPARQFEWPMLLRIFKLKEFESKLDLEKFAAERGAFVKAAGSALDTKIIELLQQPLNRHQLPAPETGRLFEAMAAKLPSDFDYAAYPHVNLFIGHLILQSELKAQTLFAEMTDLQTQITAALVKTEEESKLVALLDAHRMLKKLFALELTPDDYAGFGRTNLKPSDLVRAFESLNAEKRVKDVRFEHTGEIDALYSRALEFYRLVQERDEKMLSNIEKRMLELGKSKAVVITGGFHSGPFQNYFETLGASYALISPKLSQVPGRDTYVEAILNNYKDQDQTQAATLHDVLYAMDPDAVGLAESVAGYRNAVSRVRSQVAGRPGEDSVVPSPELMREIQQRAWALRKTEPVQGANRSELRKEEAKFNIVLDMSSVRPMAAPAMHLEAGVDAGMPMSGNTLVNTLEWAAVPVNFPEGQRESLQRMSRRTDFTLLDTHRFESGILVRPKSDPTNVLLAGFLLRDTAQAGENAVVLLHFGLPSDMVDAFNTVYTVMQSRGVAFTAYRVEATLNPGDEGSVEVVLEKRSELRSLQSLLESNTAYIVPSAIGGFRDHSYTAGPAVRPRTHHNPGYSNVARVIDVMGASAAETGDVLRWIFNQLQPGRGGALAEEFDHKFGYQSGLFVKIDAASPWYLISVTGDDESEAKRLQVFNLNTGEQLEKDVRYSGNMATFEVNGSRITVWALESTVGYNETNATDRISLTIYRSELRGLAEDVKNVMSLPETERVVMLINGPRPVVSNLTALQFLTSGRKNVVALKGAPVVFDEFLMDGHPKFVGFNANALPIAVPASGILDPSSSDAAVNPLGRAYTADELAGHKKAILDTRDRVLGTRDGMLRTFEANKFKALGDGKKFVLDGETFYANLHVLDLVVRDRMGVERTITTFKNSPVIDQDVEILSVGPETVRVWTKILSSAAGIILVNHTDAALPLDNVLSGLDLTGKKVVQVDSLGMEAEAVLTKRESYQRSELRTESASQADALLVELAGLMARRDALPDQADLIVVFGSANMKSPEAAAELFHQGRAKMILVSGRYGKHIQDVPGANYGTNPQNPAQGKVYPEAVLYQQRLVELGVPAESILVEDQSRSMEANGQLTWKLLAEKGITPQSVIFIHGPLHVLRGAGEFIKAAPAGSVPALYHYAAEMPQIPADAEARKKFEGFVLTQVQKLREDVPGQIADLAGIEALRDQFASARGVSRSELRAQDEDGEAADADLVTDFDEGRERAKKPTAREITQAKIQGAAHLRATRRPTLPPYEARRQGGPASRSELREAWTLTADEEAHLERVYEAFKITGPDLKDKADRFYIRAMFLRHKYQPKALLKMRYEKGDLTQESEAGNIILTPLLLPEEVSKLMHVTEYEQLVANRENVARWKEIAKKISLTVNTLDGGIGESLDRSKWLLNRALRAYLKDVISATPSLVTAAFQAKYGAALEQLRAGEADGDTDVILDALRKLEAAKNEGTDQKPIQVQMGAKGTDLGSDRLVVNGKTYFVGTAERRLLQLIDLAIHKELSDINFQPLTNYQSVESYRQLMERPYVEDVIEGRLTPRTYAQVFEEVGIKFNLDLQQRDLPKFELEPGQTKGRPTADNVKGKIQPGGHGQWGGYYVVFFADHEPANDGLHHIRFFGNGDNGNARFFSVVAGHMIEEHKAIIKFTTNAMPIDRKGGKEGLRIVTVDGKIYALPSQYEEVEAKAATTKEDNQIGSFYKSGQHGGIGRAGGQLFNTNWFLFQEDLLHEILNDMRAVLGENEFLTAVSATLFDKSDKAVEIDGKRYVSMDSAIGYVIHNLNDVFMIHPALESVREKYKSKYGIDRLLYYMNMPRSFFAPLKEPTDQGLQEVTDFYDGIDRTSKILVDGEEGVVPPEFNLTETVTKSGKPTDTKFWKEVQHFNDSLFGARMRNLDVLTIEGKVTARNATFIGKVKITNHFGQTDETKPAQRFIFNRPEHQAKLRKLGLLTDAGLHFENVEVTIAVDGEITVVKIDPRVASAEEIESVRNHLLTNDYEGSRMVIDDLTRIAEQVRKNPPANYFAFRKMFGIRGMLFPIYQEALMEMRAQRNRSEMRTVLPRTQSGLTLDDLQRVVLTWPYEFNSPSGFVRRSRGFSAAYPEARISTHSWGFRIFYTGYANYINGDSQGVADVIAQQYPGWAVNAYRPNTGYADPTFQNWARVIDISRRSELRLDAVALVPGAMEALKRHHDFVMSERRPLHFRDPQKVFTLTMRGLPQVLDGKRFQVQFTANGSFPEFTAPLADLAWINYSGTSRIVDVTESARVFFEQNPDTNITGFRLILDTPLTADERERLHTAEIYFVPNDHPELRSELRVSTDVMIANADRAYGRIQQLLAAIAEDYPETTDLIDPDFMEFASLLVFRAHRDGISRAALRAIVWTLNRLYTILNRLEIKAATGLGETPKLDLRLPRSGAFDRDDAVFAAARLPLGMAIHERPNQWLGAFRSSRSELRKETPVSLAIPQNMNEYTLAEFQTHVHYQTLAPRIQELRDQGLTTVGDLIRFAAEKPAAFEKLFPYNIDKAGSAYRTAEESIRQDLFFAIMLYAVSKSGGDHEYYDRIGFLDVVVNTPALASLAPVDVLGSMLLLTETDRRNFSISPHRFPTVADLIQYLKTGDMVAQYNDFTDIPRYTVPILLNQFLKLNPDLVPLKLIRENYSRSGTSFRVAVDAAGILTDSEKSARLDSLQGVPPLLNDWIQAGYKTFGEAVRKETFKLVSQVLSQRLPALGFYEDISAVFEKDAQVTVYRKDILRDGGSATSVLFRVSSVGVEIEVYKVFPSQPAEQAVLKFGQRGAEAAYQKVDRVTREVLQRNTIRLETNRPLLKPYHSAGSVTATGIAVPWDLWQIPVFSSALNLIYRERELPGLIRSELRVAAVSDEAVIPLKLYANASWGFGTGSIKIVEIVPADRNERGTGNSVRIQVTEDGTITSDEWLGVDQTIGAGFNDVTVKGFDFVSPNTPSVEIEVRPIRSELRVLQQWQPLQDAAAIQPGIYIMNLPVLSYGAFRVLSVTEGTAQLIAVAADFTVIPGARSITRPLESLTGPNGFYFIPEGLETAPKAPSAAANGHAAEIVVPQAGSVTTPTASLSVERGPGLAGASVHGNDHFVPSWAARGMMPNLGRGATLGLAGRSVHGTPTLDSNSGVSVPGIDSSRSELRAADAAALRLEDVFTPHEIIVLKVFRGLIAAHEKAAELAVRFGRVTLEAARVIVNRIAGEKVSVGAEDGTGAALNRQVADALQGLETLKSLAIPMTPQLGPKTILDRRTDFPDPIELAPVLIALAGNSKLSYQLFVPAATDALDQFLLKLKQFGESKLGFNPADLPNFKIQAQSDAGRLNSLLAGSLTDGDVPVAVVSSDAKVFGKVGASRNRARVHVSEPLNHTAVLLMAAVSLDQWVINQLGVLDDRSLLSTALGAKIAAELKALRRLLTAA